MQLSHADHAAHWLADKLPELESQLGALVEVNSFTENPDGGRKVGALLRELFAIPALESRLVSSAQFADHLVFSSRGRAGARPIALIGHLDTVFPPGSFEGYRRDGELGRGPGVLDMKGGLVVMAWALRALHATGGLHELAPLRIVIVSDEEAGSPEGQGVIREVIAGSAAALVFEAGRAGDAIITRRKGTGGVTARVRGRAAHAGNHHADGINAIWALARFVDRAQQLTDYARGITVNVGRISGGQSKNTVPDQAECALDLRVCSEADGEALLGSLRRAADEAAASVPGARIELEGGIGRKPLERSAASAALREAYAACARASGLGDGEAPLLGGGSDANTASTMGIPAIDGLGPRGEGFHTRDERIERASLVPKAQALARFLASAG